MPVAGNLDMAFMLNQPEITHCFSVEVASNPALAQLRNTAHVQFMLDGPTVSAGQVMARFKVVRGGTGEPLPGIKDLQVRYFRVPSSWPELANAREVGEGVYEAPLLLKHVGAYYLHVRSGELKLGGNEQQYASVRVVAP